MLCTLCLLWLLCTLRLLWLSSHPRALAQTSNSISPGAGRSLSCRHILNCPRRILTKSSAAAALELRWTTRARTTTPTTPALCGGSSISHWPGAASQPAPCDSTGHGRRPSTALKCRAAPFCTCADCLLEHLAPAGARAPTFMRSSWPLGALMSRCTQWAPAMRTLRHGGRRWSTARCTGGAGRAGPAVLNSCLAVVNGVVC